MARLLADENLPRPTVVRLRDAGHDVIHVGDAFAGIRDEAVLSCARDAGRVLITFDHDFGELIFARQLPGPPAIVLLRLPMNDALAPAVPLIDLLSRPEWLHGYFVTISPDGIRRRLLP